LGISALAVVAAASIWFLFLYVYEVGRLIRPREGFQISMLDEVSVWLYRERDANGQPASPYRLSRSLSILPPLDGPNWEIRIPGWIPAIGASCILGVTGLFLFGKRGRGAA
jgi:hypothetical protein